MQWVEAPPEKGKGHRSTPTILEMYADELQQLRTRPNEWAIVDTFDFRTQAAALNDRIRRGDKEHRGFESVWRKNKQQSYDVYARYIGEGQ